MSHSIQLGRINVVQGGEPHIIAEIGVNHEGSIELAKKLIEQAKEGGADAAKFQSYKAETLASKNSPAYWDTTKEATKSQFELFKKYDNFNAEQYIELAEHCQKVGIDFLSTPFDDHAIDFLDPLVPFFKIASADLTNIPFLRKVAKKNKPIVLSTGASTLGEVDIALEELKASGASQIVLLHCILNYPTQNSNAHLGMITGLKRVYPDYMIGYSDHTLPDQFMTPLLVSYLLGAQVIEKHFTHDKTLPGNDHYHAMTKEDLLVFRAQVQRTRELIGPTTNKAPISTEKISRLNARRSIVLKQAVTPGHQLTENDLTYKRPGSGISPLHWDEVIGRRAAKALNEDDILQWADVSSNRDEPRLN